MPIALLAAIPEVIIGVALLLFVYAALIVFRKPLEALLSNIPVIGSQVVGAMIDVIGGIISWALSWAGTAVYGLVQLVWVPIQAILQAAGAILALLESITTFVANVPASIVNLASWTVAAVRNLLDGLAALTARVTSVVASIPVIAHNVAAALVATAVANLTNLLNAARATLALAISTVATNLSTAVASLVSRIVAVQAALSAVIAADVNALRGIIDTDVRAINGELGQLHTLVDPLVAAGLLTLVPAIARTLTETIEECVNPTCGVIKPQLGTLNALLDIGILGAVGVVVAEAITNPEGTARVTAGVAAEVHDGAAGLASLFAGIQL